MKELKIRTYTPYDDETLAKAMGEIKKNQEQFVEIMPRELQDKFSILYYDRDPTLPSEEDMQRYNGNIPSEMNGHGMNPEKPKRTFAEIFEEHKIPIIAGILILGYYYFYIYRK